MSRLISEVILFISDKAEQFWQHISYAQFSTTQVILDILLVALLFYWLIFLIKGTRAAHVMTGMTIVVGLFLLSSLFKLVALGWLLDKFLTVFLVAIPIIFQQELRRGLEKLGQTKLSLRQAALRRESLTQILIETSFQLAEKKRGALIVVRGEDSLQEFIETGTMLDAHVSKELLLTLFHPRTVLHDGAVIIENDVLKAAGCILPPNPTGINHYFGVRHKSALSLSEQTDAFVIIVSEEKGAVSYAHNGKLQHAITAEKLKHQLLDFFNSQGKKR